MIPNSLHPMLWKDMNKVGYEMRESNLYSNTNMPNYIFQFPLETFHANQEQHIKAEGVRCNKMLNTNVHKSHSIDPYEESNFLFFCIFGYQ